MKYIKQILIFVSLMILITGCSIKGNKYSPDFNSVNELKDLNLKPMMVKKSTTNNIDEKISLRAMNMVSPYGGSFSKYLEISLEEQLKQSLLYKNDSNIQISVILLENKIDISSFSIGTANLVAEFTVTKNNEIYMKKHGIYDQWDSSFLGQVAISNAINNYPIVMQKLINKFFQDEELIKFLSK